MTHAEALARLQHMRDNLSGALSSGMRRDRWALDVAIGVLTTYIEEEYQHAPPSE